MDMKEMCTDSLVAWFTDAIYVIYSIFKLNLNLAKLNTIW
jgi:hypothetical protein